MKAQLRAEAKLQELNSINRDLARTASGMRGINRIKIEHNKRKQEALQERNDSLKQMLTVKQAEGEVKARRKQNREKALLLQSDMNETRMQNIENVLQNVVKEQQKSKTTLKNNSTSKSKGRKRKKESFRIWRFQLGEHFFLFFWRWVRRVFRLGEKVEKENRQKNSIVRRKRILKSRLKKATTMVP